MAPIPPRASNTPPFLSVVRVATLGERLRSRRLEMRMKQTDLGIRFGVRPQTIGAWEGGDKPQRRFFGQIAEFLELENADAVEALLSPPNEPEASDGSWNDDGVGLERAQVVRTINGYVASGKPLNREQIDFFGRLLDDAAEIDRARAHQEDRDAATPPMGASS